MNFPVTIVHLTDLHFQSKTALPDHAASIGKIISAEATGGTAIILITGDIAYSGKEQEYNSVQSFIGKITELIAKELPSTTVKIIPIPGNHDCNFEIESEVRSVLIRNLTPEILRNDDSIAGACIAVQEDYWKFHRTLQTEPTDKLLFKYRYTINDQTIAFYGFNTAWACSRTSKPGELFFPFGNYEQVLETDKDDIKIALLHHPTNWFRVQYNGNNKLEAEQWLRKHFTLAFIGHEHQTNNTSFASIHDPSEATFLFHGQNLFNTGTSDSGFQLLTFLESFSDGELKCFNWAKDHFIQTHPTQRIQPGQSRRRHFSLSLDTENRISSPNIPLNHSTQTTLKDFFIYPDIEALDIEQGDIDDYIDSSQIITHSNRFWALCGESQSGKTSLLKILFTDFYNAGYSPILMEGGDITNEPSDDVLKKIFRKTYKETKRWDKYKQLPKDEKILLIDDVQLSGAQHRFRKRFFDDGMRSFSKIIVTTDVVLGLTPKVLLDTLDFKTYRIKSFGHLKTNALIDKYLKTSPTQEHDKEILFQKTKLTFERVRQVIGNEIIPPYPLYLLSIIQTLDHASFDLKETSYAYCYQSLIHLALAKKGKISNENINTYINILKELAYQTLKQGKPSFTEDELLDFYRLYKMRFIAPDFTVAIAVLLNSQLLTKSDSEAYKFSYKYVYYFLAAKHISDILQTPEGKAVTKALFQELEKKDNANILVLITHHSSDPTFLDDAQLAAMEAFEQSPSISLTKNDPFYQHINEIATSISSEIIKDGIDPIKQREETLAMEDANARTKKQHAAETLETEELNEAIKPFIRAYRALDIVGQIAKNRWGSLPKEQLIDMVEEVYKTAFRTAGFVGQVIEVSQEYITQELRSHLEAQKIAKAKNREYLLRKEIPEEEVKKHVRTFLQTLSLQACLNAFSSLIHSVGAKDMNEIYIAVAKRLGSPAAQIVSFSINSYYDKMDPSQLKALSKEFENNFPAMFILRARVRSYIYHNIISTPEKQRIAAILKMKFLPNEGSKPP